MDEKAGLPSLSEEWSNTMSVTKVELWEYGWQEVHRVTSSTVLVPPSKDRIKPGDMLQVYYRPAWTPGDWSYEIGAMTARTCFV